MPPTCSTDETGRLLSPPGARSSSDLHHPGEALGGQGGHAALDYWNNNRLARLRETGAAGLPRKADGLLLITARGRPFTPAGISTLVRRLARVAGPPAADQVPRTACATRPPPPLGTTAPHCAMCRTSSATPIPAPPAATTATAAASTAPPSTDSPCCSANQAVQLRQGHRTGLVCDRVPGYRGIVRWPGSAPMDSCRRCNAISQTLKLVTLVVCPLLDGIGKSQGSARSSRRCYVLRGRRRLGSNSSRQGRLRSNPTHGSGSWPSVDS